MDPDVTLELVAEMVAVDIEEAKKEAYLKLKGFAVVGAGMTLITPNDRLAIFGARGMAGSAISRALDRAGYNQQLKPSRADLDLLDPLAVQQWFAEHHPMVVVLAAAKVGGIHANATYQADFLLENLKIQTHDRNGLAQRGAALAILQLHLRVLEQPIHEEALLNGPL